jgi:hypothetical protein
MAQPYIDLDTANSGKVVQKGPAVFDLYVQNKVAEAIYPGLWQAACPTSRAYYMEMAKRAIEALR